MTGIMKKKRILHPGQNLLKADPLNNSVENKT